MYGVLGMSDVWPTCFVMIRCRWKWRFDYMFDVVMLVDAGSSSAISTSNVTKTEG